VTPLIFCVTDFIETKRVSGHVEKILVRPSNKIVGLHLAPFSEMVVNHCSLA